MGEVPFGQPFGGLGEGLQRPQGSSDRHQREQQRAHQCQQGGRQDRLVEPVLRGAGDPHRLGEHQKPALGVEPGLQEDLAEDAALVLLTGPVHPTQELIGRPAGKLIQHAARQWALTMHWLGPGVQGAEGGVGGLQIGACPQHGAAQSQCQRGCVGHGGIRPQQPDLGGLGAGGVQHHQSAASRPRAVLRRERRWRLAALAGQGPGRRSRGRQAGHPVEGRGRIREQSGEVLALDPARRHPVVGGEPLHHHLGERLDGLTQRRVMTGTQRLARLMLADAQGDRRRQDAQQQESQQHAPGHPGTERTAQPGPCGRLAHLLDAVASRSFAKPVNRPFRPRTTSSSAVSSETTFEVSPSLPML